MKLLTPACDIETRLPVWADDSGRTYLGLESQGDVRGVVGRVDRWLDPPSGAKLSELTCSHEFHARLPACPYLVDPAKIPKVYPDGDGYVRSREDTMDIRAPGPGRRSRFDDLMDYGA